MLHPTQTDILLTDLLKGMPFHSYFHIINSYVTYKFYIESAILRQYDEYIQNEIPNFQPVQVTCHILENENLSYRTLIIYISDHIVQRLYTIKTNEIIVTDDPDDVTKIVEKESGHLCLENI